MSNFKHSVVVITGAGSGIGCAIAHRLLQEGAQASLIDINGKALETEFSKYAPSVRLFAIDVTNESMVSKTIDEIAGFYGRIDILINCAGISGLTNILSHEVSSEDLQAVFEVNFFSCFYTAKAILPHMLKRNYGRILHIASVAGKEGNVGMLAYSASKAAVIGMTKVQGKEYAESGITINALAPTVIRTALVDAMPEEQVLYMTNKIPMKRCGTMDEAVDLALFIISEQNSFTTGFTYDLTGGRVTY